MPRKLRVLLLCHETLIPPLDAEGLEDARYWEVKTELDVRDALEDLGHEVRPIGLVDDLTPLRKALDEWRPHVVFNLLEEFHHEVVYDAHVVSYLVLKGVAYTGCNARGLILARDKALSKKILSYHRIAVPRFAVFPMRRAIRRPRALPFPLIVKSLVAEGSEGIAQASIVHDDAALVERVEFIHRRVLTDAVAEEFIDGRELYVGAMGVRRMVVLPPVELVLDGLPPDAPRIATRKVKWDDAYRQKHGIDVVLAKELPEAVDRQIPKLVRRICRALGIDGHVRMDFRLRADGKLFFLEANPNPDVAWGGELATAAEAIGMGYEAMIQKLLDQAMRRHR